jgi:hypothetical protein
LLVGLLEALIFFSQRSHPEWYPWIALVGVVLVPCASFAMSWGRIRLSDMLEKMAPTFLFLTALAFGLLLAEGQWALWALTLFAALASFMSLELLFLLIHHPSGYPVNGLSRINIAYVPLTIWYALSTSAGLMIFLHMDPAIHIALAAGLGATLFRTTGHPGATRRQNFVWTLVGLLAGVEIGWIGILLPLSMEMHGLIAALLFVGVLRVRRYLYDPKPGSNIAWTEAAALAAFLAASLFTAKWI